MASPSEIEKTFFEKRRKLGRGVGLDAAGNLIHAAGPDAAA